MEAWFDLNPFPWWLDSIALLLGGIGFLMAAPFIFEKFWAHPLANIEFDRIVDENERILIAFLKNPPIKNRFLKALRVRRSTVESLTVVYRIVESGTNKEMAPMRQATIYSDEEREPIERQRVTLPPTYSIAANFGVVRWDIETKRALVLGDNLRPELVLGNGRYVAQVQVIVDGEPQRHQREFIVGDRSDDLVWVIPKET